MLKTSQEVFNLLLKDDKITTKTGQISFHLSNVGIVVKRRDVVGNILQEWFEGWLRSKGVDFDTNENTQMPPDIFLNPKDHTTGLLEIKAFNYNVSPAFDIADFKAFVKELKNKPYHLLTDFLIFAYEMDEESGDVFIREVWLKKIWEIMRPMATWPITVQYKNGVLQKMRPACWYAHSSKFKIFESMEDFLAAFEETIYQNQATHAEASMWRREFKASYEKFFGKTIDFPRWSEIEHKYVQK